MLQLPCPSAKSHTKTSSLTGPDVCFSKACERGHILCDWHVTAKAWMPDSVRQRPSIPSQPAAAPNGMRTGLTAALDAPELDAAGLTRETSAPPTIGRRFVALLESFGLVDVPPDADGLYDGLVLPREQYMYIWWLAWLSFVSGIVAVARGYTDLCFVPFGVWLTSILYWYKPDYSWRRYVDMAWVQCALWYQVYRAVGAENMVEYYVISGETGIQKTANRRSSW